MASAAHTQQTIAPGLLKRWRELNDKIVALADAFPAEHYDASPAPGVRSFAGVLRHLAFWNGFVAASARGENPDGAQNEIPSERLPTKRAILERLQKSAQEAADALEAGHADGKEDLCFDFLQHSAEHYGQLVVYCRMHGIVPPASRPAQ